MAYFLSKISGNSSIDTGLSDKYFLSFSKSISETILNDEAFVRLSREYMEKPNYGLPKIFENDKKYLSDKPVSIEELPLIFDKKYAINFM